ncbi:MAG TPA: peptide deformylase [Blastocatellia bacterium]|nr:peptide deformylase [Blastocatellia bacterium]
MAERRILQLGDPALWQPSERIESPLASSTMQLVTDLADTLAAFRARTGFGRAIAAPQIGVPERVIFVRMQLYGFSGPLVNPVIVDRSTDEFELWDDCFSFPDLMVRVRRAASIRVTYTDDHGVDQTIDAAGDLSELLQHEIDHLDGVLAVDRAVSAHAFITRSEWERQRSL